MTKPIVHCLSYKAMPHNQYIYHFKMLEVIIIILIGQPTFLRQQKLKLTSDLLLLDP